MGTEWCEEGARLVLLRPCDKSSDASKLGAASGVVVDSVTRRDRGVTGIPSLRGDEGASTVRCGGFGTDTASPLYGGADAWAANLGGACGDGSTDISSAGPPSSFEESRVDLMTGAEWYEDGSVILLCLYGRKLCVFILGWAGREVVVSAAPWDEDTNVSSLWGDEGASTARFGGFGGRMLSLLCVGNGGETGVGGRAVSGT
jgi:hypothetical protein